MTDEVVRALSPLLGPQLSELAKQHSRGTKANKDLQTLVVGPSVNGVYFIPISGHNSKSQV